MMCLEHVTCLKVHQQNHYTCSVETINNKLCLQFLQVLELTYAYVCPCPIILGISGFVTLMMMYMST